MNYFDEMKYFMVTFDSVADYTSADFFLENRTSCV